MAEKQGFSRRAYEPIPSGETYDPYVSRIDDGTLEAEYE